MATAKLVDRQTLKTLNPLESLNPENFLELAGKAQIEDVAMGRTLFRIGDVDHKHVYVLQGQIMLTDSDGSVAVVEAGSAAALQPLAHLQPRQHSAKARTDCQITRIDSDLLDILLTWDQLSGIEVIDIDGSAAAPAEEDWMTRILQSKAFLQIPPANIQAMFMRMQEVVANAGDVVIRQGDEGDFYYIIKSGRVKVTRAGKSGGDIVLAHLEAGNAFGEEALLAETRRNATVSMETDGALMRLSKDDFLSLLREPALNWVDRAEADALVAAGARWLDVRLDTERAAGSLPDDLHIPLFMLRLKALSLERSVPYVLYCDTGRRSSAAAFLLGERGLKTYVLRGGFGAV